MKGIPAFEIPRVSSILLENFSNLAYLLFPEHVQFLVQLPNFSQQPVYLAE